ncbi:MAG: hypothetical protein EXR79_15580 [Myxococcales bacterium]|nr:hypothetical protein [Myxococcales bacterium]
MNSPRPRPHPSPHAWNGRALVWAAAVACVSAAVGCAQAPVAAPTADAAGPATDTAAATEAGSLDAAADAFPASASAQAVDLAAIVLVAKLRTASNAAAQAKWPGPAPAIWPGWALHKLPLYLVAVDAKQKPVRGFLVGVAPLPAGAVAVPAQASVAVPAELTVARWDAGLKDIGPGEEMSPLVTAGGIDLLLATYTAERLADAALWATGLGRAAMLRLHADAAWQQVQGCGQNSYPRYEEAIALQLLECAVLQEAVQAADSAGAEARLREWYAVRRRAIEVTVLVAKRWRHYDVQFGTATYAGQRLIAAAGLRTPAQHVAAHVAALQVLLDAKPTEFDSVSLGYSAPGAAALEVATRLGWEVEPAYRATDAVYHVLPAKLGEPPASLVDVAKGRHPWAKFAATAADVMKVPEEGGMP